MMIKRAANPIVKSQLLLIRGRRDFSHNVECRLADMGFHPSVVDGDQIRQVMVEQPIDIVLLETTETESWVSQLEFITSTWPSVPVIVLLEEASVAKAVRATQLGAIDVIENVDDLSRLRSVVSGPGIKRRSDSRNDVQVASPGREGEAADRYNILGNCQAIADVLDLVRDVARTDATVLILGESGTGKELLARAIHEHSQRNQHPFVPVNVAALPATIAESILFGHDKGAYTGADTASKGWCETADKGTLMLDEIGEMDILLQAKLLRFLQDGSFMRVGSSTLRSADVRVVAATNRDPASLVEEQRMRADLYYRLNVFPIRMPPLRERKEDIPILAQTFLRRSAADHHRPVQSFSEEALHCMISYDWPGNIRQLENLVTRMVLLSRESTISAQLLPAEVRGQQLPVRNASLPISMQPALSRMDSMERTAIVTALRQSRGNAVAAAKLLGVGQATIYRKIKRYSIELKQIKSVARSSGSGADRPPTQFD